MKLFEVKYLLIIVLAIVEMSLEDCHIKIFDTNCTKIAESKMMCLERQYMGLVLKCDDLTELDDAQYNRRIKIIEVHSKNSSDTISSEFFEGFNAILALDVSDSSIRYIESGAFYNLSNLEYLDLSGNNIQYFPEGVFDDLTKFEELHLARNKINCVKATSLPTIEDQSYNTPCAIINCISLIVLDVSNNKIDHFEFGNCTKLKVLELSGDNIKLLPDGTLNNLKNLEKLKLARNKISCLKANPLGVNDKVSKMPCMTIKCDSLLSLDLSANVIENLELVNCTKLQTLIIAGNYINDYKFGNSPLTTLNISDNKLGRITRENLQNYTKLLSLNLGHNSLFETIDMAPNLFRSNQLLRELNLSCTSLKRITIGTFMPLRNLATLDLSLNYLTYIPKSTFMGNKYLQKLYINGNQLTSLSLGSRITDLNVNDNLFTCTVLLKIIRTNSYNLIKGNTFNTTNINGIRCEEESHYETNTERDSTVLKAEYLSFLIRGQDDMKNEFTDLQAFLNETSFHQKHYSQDNMEAVGNTLLQRDVVLYTIILAGFAVVAAFFVIYYNWSNRRENTDNILITYNASS